MINIGILGNGTVGSGVVELLNRNSENISKRIGTRINVAKILVKDISKHMNCSYNSLITDDINEILSEDLDIVVEVMGGTNPAYDYIKKFLKMKKHVVTANKDIISKHGQELSDIAKDNGVTLHFEASVGGGIPIIKPLKECLAGNKIKSISAILNGTTNFILSKMHNENMEYERALKIAQNLGFAEANPDSDVLGYDTARKLSILSSISFGRRVQWDEIGLEGIVNIDSIDLQYAKQLNSTIKLLALSRLEEGKINASVRPVLLTATGKLGSIHNEFNGILIEGDAAGQLFFYGKGAGKFPTASAVLGDILNVIENKNDNRTFTADGTCAIKTLWSNEASWLLRVFGTINSEVFEKVSEIFPDCIILSSPEASSELAFVVEEINEEMLDSRIELIRSINGVISTKKLLKLDDL